MSRSRTSARENLQPAKWGGAICQLPSLTALLSVLPVVFICLVFAFVPVPDVHAASAYLADENGQTEINVDVEDEFQVVLYVVDITGVAGYECKITVSGPATPIGSAVHGDWFADNHTIFDGIYPVPADYHTAMLLSPLSISGSGAVVVFTLHADEEGSVAINVDSEYFLFAESDGDVIELDAPSTLYVTVTSGESLGAGEEGAVFSIGTTGGGDGAFILGQNYTVFFGAQGIDDRDLQIGGWIEDGDRQFMRYFGVEVPGDIVVQESYWVHAVNPGSLWFNDWEYEFSHWLVDGVRQDEDAVFQVTANVEVTAVFLRDWKLLDIRSFGWKTVLVEVSYPPNHTAYENTPVSFGMETDWAVTITLASSFHNRFDHWEVNGVPQQQGTYTINIEMDEDKDVRALYMCDLRVASARRSGISIEGTPSEAGGVTDGGYYDRSLIWNSPITLTVTESSLEGFHHWVINDKEQLSPPSPSVTFTLTEETVATAVFDITTFTLTPPCSIQAAIDDSFSGDTIVLNPGTYSGPGNFNIDFKGRSITLRGTDPDTRETVQATIVDCLSGGFGFIFQKHENSAVLEGITIKNGRTTDLRRGGAITCFNSTPTIRKNIIENCHSLHYWEGGGGIFVYIDKASAFNLSISDNTVRNCSTAGRGGGICVYRDGSGTVHVEFIGNQVEGCTSRRYGGGVYCFGLASALVNGTDFCGNTTQGYSHDETWGGGICLHECGSILVKDCLLEQNRTGLTDQDGHGGGIVLLDPSAEGTKEIRNCTAIGNIAHSGAGIDIRNSSGEDRDLRVLVQNCLVVGNSDKAGLDDGFRGAGIAVTWYSADIVNCTIADNVLFYIGAWYPVGGGLAFYGSGSVQAPSTVLNSIIRANKAKCGNQIGVGPGYPSYIVVSHSSLDFSRSAARSAFGSRFRLVL